MGKGREDTGRGRRTVTLLFYDKPLESNIFDEGHNYNETGLAH